MRGPMIVRGLRKSISMRRRFPLEVGKTIHFSSGVSSASGRTRKLMACQDGGADPGPYFPNPAPTASIFRRKNAI
jgi:hypothetical protein